MALNYLLAQMVNRDYSDDVNKYGIFKTTFSVEEETESIQMTKLEQKLACKIHWEAKIWLIIY